MEENIVLQSLEEAVTDEQVSVEEIAAHIKKLRMIEKRTKLLKAEKAAEHLYEIAEQAGVRIKVMPISGNPKVAPKYAHPETGQTWTGRGKQPKWFRELVASGVESSELLIEE